MARPMMHLGASILLLLMAVVVVSSQGTLYPQPPGPYASPPPPFFEGPTPPVNIKTVRSYFVEGPTPPLGQDMPPPPPQRDPESPPDESEWASAPAPTPWYYLWPDPTYEPNVPPPQRFVPPGYDSNHADAKVARCMDKNFPDCYRTLHFCPPGCPQWLCVVDCGTCSPVCDCYRPGAVCQDPRFVGADGLTFYFHGKRDKDFCIVSDSNLHINAHFIGKRNANMKRDFTWVQSLGIMFDDHQLYIAALKTSTWDDSADRLALKFNGESISLPTKHGAKWNSTNVPMVSITRSRHTNAVVIDVEGNFQVKVSVVPITHEDSKVHNYGITGDDCFAHLDLSFRFYSLGADVNGVLGQTYASNYVSKVKVGVLMPVMGGEKEFASSNIFSTDCAASQFSGRLNSLQNVGQGSLSCTSGTGGKGVICKR